MGDNRNPKARVHVALPLHCEQDAVAVAPVVCNAVPMASGKLTG